MKDIRTPKGKWQFNPGVTAGGYQRENCGSVRPSMRLKQQPFSIHTTDDVYHGLDNHVAARATHY